MAGIIRAFADEQVIRSLSDWSPQSFRDLADSLHISPKATFARCDRMHERGLLHIAGWTRARSGPPLPLFALGRAPDAPRPAPLPIAVKVKRNRERVMADPKRHAAALRAKRAAIKKRLADDYDFVLQRRTYAREWSRKTYGHKPRAPRLQLDPLLAALLRPLPETTDA